MKTYSPSVGADFMIDQVLDSREYDKQPFKRLATFAYYEYIGATRAVSTKYDIRHGMVYGVTVDTRGVLMHVPQYKTVFKINTKAANTVLRKSKLDYSSFYKEV